MLSSSVKALDDVRNLAHLAMPCRAPLMTSCVILAFTVENQPSKRDLSVKLTTSSVGSDTTPDQSRPAIFLRTFLLVLNVSLAFLPRRKSFMSSMIETSLARTSSASSALSTLCLVISKSLSANSSLWRRAASRPAYRTLKSSLWALSVLTCPNSFIRSITILLSEISREFNLRTS